MYTVLTYRNSVCFLGEILALLCLIVRSCGLLSRCPWNDSWRGWTKSHLWLEQIMWSSSLESPRTLPRVSLCAPICLLLPVGLRVRLQVFLRVTLRAVCVSIAVIGPTAIRCHHVNLGWSLMPKGQSLGQSTLSNPFFLELGRLGWPSHTKISEPDSLKAMAVFLHLRIYIICQLSFLYLNIGEKKEMLNLNATILDNWICVLCMWAYLFMMHFLPFTELAVAYIFLCARYLFISAS